MKYVLLGFLCAAGLFLGILLAVQLGRYVRSRQSGKDFEAKRPGLAAIEGALFGLMGLILAFSFYGAGARYDARRQLIVEEANCIGTAYLRLDLLPTKEEPGLQEKFREYVDARLATYRALPDIAKARAEAARAVSIQRDIWTGAVTASQETSSIQGRILVLPALNAMFDIANTRMMATKMHPPIAIYWLVATLIFICSILAGYEMGGSTTRNWVHVLSFAILLAVTFYVTLDMEFPRLGLMHIKAFDQTLIDVRNSMGEGTLSQGLK